MTGKWLTVATAVVMAAACTKKVETRPETAAAPAPDKPAVQQTLESVGLDGTALDRTADPCDDFYQFACGGWLARTAIPDDKAKWSRSFSEIDLHNEQTLHEILEAARTNPGDDAGMQKLGAYYGACMDEEGIEQAGLAPIQPLFDVAASVKDVPTLARALTELHKNRVWALFDVSAEQDFKQATQVIAYLDQNGLGLPDRDYYFKDDEKSVKLREAYLAYVGNMLRLAGAKEADARAQANEILALETAIAKVSKTRVERRDPQGLYNKIDRSGVKQTVPSFPWDAYFKALGQEGVEDVVVTSIPYFQGVEKLLNEVPAKTWQTYLRWNVLRSTASTLPKAFVDESFRMAQAITGQKQLEERWKRCIDATDAALGELLAQPYVKLRFGGGSKEATEEMIREIRAAFGRQLDDYSWMDDETKKLAREKLEAMTFHIGYPDKWRKYTFEVGDSFAANALASRVFETHRDLNKIGKPVDRGEWAMSPPTVNAYYNPLKNEMVFPAGILQPPFFDVNAAVPVNMGGMGMVVGHELTHGFDDQGSQFAADGNLKNWWQPEVAEAFKARTQCVAEQYANYEAVPGLKLNGNLTLGENIADIGGVELAFKAYRSMRADAPERVVADGFSEDQLFFLAVGQAWRTNVRDEIARMYVQVDPHSPPRWRVNGSLANVSAFAEAFACEPGTTMRPVNACTVW